MSETIQLNELKSAFGTYIGSSQKDILRLLTQPTVSEKFMTTVASADLLYRASKAVIDDLVQGFQKGWTPKGNAKFTPLSIPQRRHKFDIEFYPDEVFDTWVGFLTNESSERKSWGISKYILEMLVIPKILENRELKLIAKGKYEEPVPGTPQAVGFSMDGFLTILEEKRAAGTSNINFISLADLTPANIFDQIEKFEISERQVASRFGGAKRICKRLNINYILFSRKRQDGSGKNYYVSTRFISDLESYLKKWDFEYREFLDDCGLKYPGRT